MSNNFKLFDSISDSLAVINKAGEIIFVNKAWKKFSKENKGIEASTGIANNYLTICDATMGDDSRYATEASIGIGKVINREQERFELEYPCHSPTEKRWFILRVSPVSTDSELTLLTHINITNRKLAEIEVKKNNDKARIINKRLNSTLHKIVHDIQNPINTLLGLINISKSKHDIGTIKEHLEMIEMSSRNVKSFVDDSLKQISSNNDFDTVLGSALIKEYLNTIEPLYRSKSIRIITSVLDEVEILTNAFEFQSIFSNLIGNSIKYCDNNKPEKFIRITFSSNEEKAILKVEDNGIGIINDDIPKLTERNFQVNKNLSSGEGLGLFMVNESVAQLGGKLQINSEIGIGSEFIVELPNGQGSLQHLISHID